MLCSRRHFLQGTTFHLSGLAAAWLLKQDGLLAQESSAEPPRPELEPPTFDLLPKTPPRPPQARAMISMYMLGGPSQID
ncbi:MAG: DUF1501 domain-containing protein, partial [Planctomycetales bacterium]|nr:DUF1501 domain-containing protein [Planctomycetales bacterium]